MPKRIVICADGTWNTATETDQGHPCPTNVTKVARGVASVDADNVTQIVYYHSGVGTSFGQRVFGGAFGVGLFNNVIDCYRFIVNNYVPGDELWFFGFSRGAFTVRSLSGLIRKAGILTNRNEDRESDAVVLYRDYSEAPDSPNSVKFRTDYSYGDTDIKFIGVWDTVGALGIPGMDGSVRLPEGQDWQFHDVSLSRRVGCARHALSIHEHRKEFVPTLWELQPADPTRPQTLKQVWFTGVHSDVGGGYPEAGLSDVALNWMVDEAMAAGLTFGPEIKEGLNLAPLANQHDSFKVLYKILDFLQGNWGGQFRTYNQDPAKNTRQAIHPSVVDRFQKGIPKDQWPPSFEAQLTLLASDGVANI